MRLTLEQIEAIKQTAHTVLGAESRVILFGSRTDDAKKGGDIDLLFETTHRVENRATTIGALDLAHKEAAHLRYPVDKQAPARLALVVATCFQIEN